jgi:hypothetical protein
MVGGHFAALNAKGIPGGFVGPASDPRRLRNVGSLDP